MVTDAVERSDEVLRTSPGMGSRLVPVHVVESAPKARRQMAEATEGDGLLELVLPIVTVGG